MRSNADPLVTMRRATVAAGRVIEAAVHRRPVLAAPQQVENRERICSSCADERDGWCGLCGCKLSLKRAFAAERCPAGRWA